MVFKRTLGIKTNGYLQVPVVPRIPKCAKGKRSTRKNFKVHKMCPIDLLATVAKMVLLEKENSLAAADVITSTLTNRNDVLKQPHLKKGGPLAHLSFHQGSGSCKESASGSGTSIHGHFNNFVDRNLPNLKDSISKAHSNSKGDARDEDAYAAKCVVDGSIEESRKSKCWIPTRYNGRKCTPGSRCTEGQVGVVNSTIYAVNPKPWQMTPLFASGMHGMGELDKESRIFVSQVSSIKDPLCSNNLPNKYSFPAYRDCKQVNAYKDDDENSSRCNGPCTLTRKTFRSCYRRHYGIRKLTSKYWKVASSCLKGRECSNTDVESKAVFLKKGLFSSLRRTQRGLLMRRKPIRSCLTSDFKATGEPCTRKRKSTYHSDIHVKLGIKSFRVPELFLDIPETATVGSLKRSIMEAMTALLAGGINVGIILKGKKVKDDSKTLFQAGISHDDKLDTLGFTLEPNTSQASSSILPFCGPEKVTGVPVAIPASEELGPTYPLPDSPLNFIVNTPEGDHDSVWSTANIRLDKIAKLKPVVSVSPMNTAGILTSMPVLKLKQTEMVRRRRRPFSVTEVEALILTVEKLGTGRWRDVKHMAFDEVNHRTYVDLKDKWKTLVHTAMIPPQQRRGEPVPQELLDRVLSANAYWSEQQAKL